MLQFLSASNQSYVLSVCTLGVYWAVATSQSHSYNNWIAHRVDVVHGIYMKSAEDNNDENLLAMRQGFPISIFTRVRAHWRRCYICTIQLNNLIIHMQIRTYARETLKTKTAILTLCTSNFNSDCVCSLFTFTCALRPYHIKSNRCVCWRESALEWESVWPCVKPCAERNTTHEMLVIYEVCCEYGCQIPSVVRIFLNKFFNLVQSLGKYGK